jgi:hypothetical protein
MRYMLAVLLMVLAFAPGASAHKVMGFAPAMETGQNVAHWDCGRAGDWWCADFPIAGPQVLSDDAHTWVVRTWYEEQYALPFWDYRVCHTTVWIWHGVVVNAGKWCD